MSSILSVPTAFDPTEWANCSPQQAAQIEHVLDGHGSLGIIARAGCGKTYVLEQITKAITKYRRGSLVAMAFNKPIAGELEERFKGAGYDWRIAQAGTVHSYGFGAWRKHVGSDVKVDGGKVGGIISELSGRDKESIYFRCSSTIEKLVSLAKQRTLGYVGDLDDTSAWADIFDHFGLEDTLEEEVSTGELIRCAQRVFNASMEQCKQVVDFDDMLFAPLYFKASFLWKDWVLLDEAQDTNPARRAVALAMMRPRTGRMVYVGDPAQAIYGFTGADSNSMELLRQATNATVLPLNVTRRCPKNVVKEAQKFVPDFVAHEDAPDGGVRSISWENLETEGLTKDDVILCRLTWPLVSTALSLIGKGIACRVEGKDIGEDLISLVQRVESKSLTDLLPRLDQYQQKQTAKFKAKGQEYRAERLADQADCLRVITNTCFSEGNNQVEDLVGRINGMFGDTPEGKKPELLTLATGHRSKGREWDRVYLYGREKWLPSPHAKKDWQKDQELNLEYVMLTRSKRELIDVPARDRDRQEEIGRAAPVQPRSEVEEEPEPDLAMGRGR